MKKYLLPFLAVALILAACSSQNTQQTAEPSQSTPEASPSTSIIGAWKLSAYGAAGAPTPAVATEQAGVTFNTDGTVTGNSGCNGFGGNYTLEDNQVSFDQIASTLMACDDPLMAQEDAVHKVLTETAIYKIEGDTLTITNHDSVLVLTRRTLTTAEPESAPLIGSWKLSSRGTRDTLSSALADVEAGLTFNEDGTLTGTSGCNEFGGNYTVDGNEITFNEIVSTLLLCGPPVMEQEKAMYQILSETVAFQVEANTLTIMKNGMLLVFER